MKGFFDRRRVVKEAHQSFNAMKTKGLKAGKTYQDLPIVTKRLHRTTYKGSFFITSEEFSNVDLSRYQILVTIIHAADMLRMNSYVIDQESEYAEIVMVFNSDDTRASYHDLLVDISLLRVDEE